MGRALLIYTVVLSTVLAIYQLSIRNQQSVILDVNNYTITQKHALSLANAGVDHTLNFLKSSPYFVTGENDSLELNMGSVNFKERVYIKVLDFNHDTTLSNSPREIKLISTGVADNVISRVITLAKLTDNGFPLVNSSLGLYSKTNDFEMEVKGSNFSISGYDQNLDGSIPVFSSPVHGIFASNNTTKSSITNPGRSKLSTTQQNQIIGKGVFTPSILTDKSVPQPDFEQLINDFKTNATRNYSSKTVSSANWGTPSSPEIVVIKDKLQVTSGDLNGYGILIIEGEDVQLQVEDDFNWQGLVIFNGETVQVQVAKGDMNIDGLVYSVGSRTLRKAQNTKTQIQVQSGSLNIHGSLMIGQQGAKGNPQVQVQIEKDLDIQYSTEALNIANSVTSGKIGGGVSFVKYSVFEDFISEND